MLHIPVHNEGILVNFEQLKRMAEQEEPAFAFDTFWHHAITKVPKYSASDFTLPEGKAKAFVLWCDANKLPAFHVCENCVSIAHTYSDLYRYEQAR